jgi:nitrous oxide reductase accessory protein NosL
MKRRELLKFSVLGCAGFIAARPGEGATAPATNTCPGDGTPSQFLPKLPPDPVPHENDLDKYPKCPYCSMDLRSHHRTRMLIHYANDIPDPTCSIHCAAISLAINLFWEPKAIWVGDNAVDTEPRPLVDATKATYLVGSDLPGIMTWNSKTAYGSPEAAAAAQKIHGGKLMDYRQTLKMAYNDMDDDLEHMRKGRAERIRRAAKPERR